MEDVAQSNKMPIVKFLCLDPERDILFVEDFFVQTSCFIDVFNTGRKLIHYICRGSLLTSAYPVGWSFLLHSVSQYGIFYSRMGDYKPRKCKLKYLSGVYRNYILTLKDFQRK